MTDDTQTYAKLKSPEYVFELQTDNKPMTFWQWSMRRPYHWSTETQMESED